MSARLFVFGLGYSAGLLARELLAAGWRVAGTTRDAAKADRLRRDGIETFLFGRTQPLDPAALAGTTHLLSSIAPDAAGDPVLDLHGADLRALGLRWSGYLSTTGVYGDLGGRWAFEETPLSPQSREAINRAKAEDQWLSAGASLFRLPGIYGPGRSQLERVREPGARRIIKPDQVFSRAHVSDIASALKLAMSKRARGAFNICDDEPAPADEVLAYAAQLLGLAPPPAVAFEDANLSPAAKRFYAECKRVSNAKAKAMLGWRPRFPTYREGLLDCLQRAAST